MKGFHRLLPTLVALALVVPALIYREELLDWFFVQVDGEAEVATAVAERSPDVATTTFEGRARDRVLAVLANYERARDELANDRMVELGTLATSLGGGFRELDETLSGSTNEAKVAAAELALRGQERSTEFGAAADIEQARERFQKLSEVVIGLTVLDPSLREGLFVFECPMVEGFQKWVQRSETKENPYMGQAMLACGRASEFTAPLPASGGSPGQGDDDDIAHYTCSMDPSVRSQTPGVCPICSMDLTAVTQGELRSGTVLVDGVRRQRIGVTLEPAVRGTLSGSVRATGRVSVDEAAVQEVTARVEGWVVSVRANRTGERVRRGRPLLRFYSPVVYAAQQELIIAKARGGALLESAKQKLRLLGVSRVQIERVLSTEQAEENMALFAPTTGYVLTKNVTRGAHFKAGETLFTIGSLDEVWIEAEIPESDMAHVAVGTELLVRTRGGHERSARVDHIYPDVEAASRAGRFRIVLDNPDGALRVDEFVDIELSRAAGEHLSVPSQAVIYAGERRFVFVDLGDDRFAPKQVLTGATIGERTIVIDGLDEGDQVVRSGNFLLASESRIRSPGIWASTP